MDTVKQTTQSDLQESKLSKRTIWDVRLCDFMEILQAQSDPELISEFFDELSGGVDSNVIAIEYKNMRIARLITIYNIWVQYGSEAAKDILIKEGYAPERFKGLIKNEEMQLKILHAQYDKKDAPVIIDRKWFYTMLKQISDYKKYQIEDKITVGQFCSHYRDLGEYIKHLSKNG